MPALPNVNKVLKVQFTGLYGIAPWANVMHLRYAGTAPTNSECNDIADDLQGIYMLEFGAYLSSDVSLEQTIVTDLTSSTASIGTFVGTTSATGANAQNMNAGVAIALSWKIHRRYRGGHPRTYLIGMEASNLTDTQHFDNTYVGNVLTAAQSFLTAVNAYTQGAVDPFELGQVSYYTAGALRVTPVFDPFLDVAVDTRVDSQRRRNGRS